MLSTSARIHSSIIKKKLFVFDFDGVIADSNNIKTEAFREIFEEFGSDVVNRILDHHKENASMTRYEKFRYYYENYLNLEISEDKVAQLGSKFSEIVLDKIINSPEIEGSWAFLEQLRALNKICAINSATPHDEINLIVKRRKLSKFFEKVYGSPSSKLDILKSLMDDYGLENDDLVFFGDDKSDKLAADRLNILFIGIGNKSKIKLFGKEKSCLSIDNFNEVDLVNYSHESS